MIDTIVLTLPQDAFEVIEHSRFAPSTEGLFGPPFYSLNGRGAIRCTQNPTAQDAKDGSYLPRLTVTKRITRGGFAITLRIEFSAPKLLYGNNFDELSDAQLDDVINALGRQLAGMGVVVAPQTLFYAPASAVHYSKNIVMSDGATPYGVIQELRKINYSQRFDTNQTDFRNEGHSFKFRTNGFEVAFYDKLKDLRQAKISQKRAIERGSAVTDQLVGRAKPAAPFEVLRMEVRLNNRRKIRDVLKALEVKVEPTLSTLFSAGISQRLLNRHWAQIEAAHGLLSYKPKSPKELLARLLASNPSLTPRKAVLMFGLKMLAEDVGIRELRTLVDRGGSSENWYRLYNEAQALQWPQAGYSVFEPMRQALNEFKPVKLALHSQQIYNDT